MFWIQITMNIIFIEFILQLNLNLIKFKHFYEIYFKNFILNIIEHIKVNDCSCWFYSYFYFAYPFRSKYIQCMINVNISCHSCAYLQKKTYDAKNVCVIELNSTQTALETFHFSHWLQFQTTKPSLRHLFRAFNSTYCTNSFNLLLRHPLLFSNHVIPVHAARIFHLSIKTVCYYSKLGITNILES